MSNDILQYMSDFDIYFDKDQLAPLNDYLFSKIIYFQNFKYRDPPQADNNKIQDGYNGNIISIHTYPTTQELIKSLQNDDPNIDMDYSGYLGFLWML